MIGPLTSIGERPHRVFVDVLGPPVRDGEGGYTEAWVPLDPPALFVKIQPSGGQDATLTPDGTTVQSNVTHTITGPYHAGLTTQCRLRLGARMFRVTGVVSRDERAAESVLQCVETTP